MARIEYSGLISQIRGKIAGTVFSKFQGGFSAYRKGSPRKQGSQAQQQVRNYFYAFATAWKTLTETQRENWRFVAAETPLYDRLGILRPINGFAYFVKFNQFLAGWMPVPQVEVTTDLEPAYPTTIVADPATFSISDTGWILDDLPITLTTLGDSVYPNLALIYFSQPIPYSDIVYHGTWYKAAAIQIAANLGADEEIEETLTGIIMPKGFRSFPGALHRMKVELIAIDSAQFAASALADVESDPDPFSFFPRLLAPNVPDDENTPQYYIGEWYWSLYWERQNEQSNPLLFEIEVSAAYSNVPLEDAHTLDYGFMFLEPITLLGAGPFYWTAISNDSYDIGQLLFAAIGSPPGIPNTSWFIYQRYRTRLLSGGGWSPYGYQQFDIDVA